MRRTMRAALVLLTSTSGCAPATGVALPHPDVAAIHHPVFEAMAPRAVGLSIEDAREPLPPLSSETVAELDRVLRQVFAESGIRVDGGSPYSLHVRLVYPPVREPFKPGDCVKMVGTFRGPRGELMPEHEQCFGHRNVYGGRLSNQVDQVYTEMLNSIMTMLDRESPSLFGEPDAPPPPRVG